MVDRGADHALLEMRDDLRHGRIAQVHDGLEAAAQGTMQFYVAIAIAFRTADRRLFHRNKPKIVEIERSR